MTYLDGKRIAFVGGGMMGEAIIGGLLRRELATPGQLVVSEPLAPRREYLTAEYGLATTDANQEAVFEADLVLLAVKPQVLPRVFADLGGHIPLGAPVVSIVAGATLATLQKGLRCDALVRVMPNTPGQIGEGISVWTATSQVGSADRETARSILGALGQEIYVEDEAYLDMATALSGSGPAYVFLFIEALTDAGVQMGFARDVAQKLALQTVKGSAAYAQERGVHPAILRNAVTSPGGTTAAALYEFDKGGLRATVITAVLAAYHQAQVLGKPKSCKS